MCRLGGRPGERETGRWGWGRSRRGRISGRRLAVDFDDLRRGDGVAGAGLLEPLQFMQSFVVGALVPHPVASQRLQPGILP